MSSTFENRRNLMVESQLRTNKVTDENILAAFATVPREAFLPEAMRELAYIDEDLMIAEDRFLMEPMVLARMIQALDLTAGDSVLDIGSASGYSAAILSRLAQSVVGIESSAAMARTAETTLHEIGADNAVVLNGALVDGFADEAPYNAIVIEGAVEYIPPRILGQLGDGGSLVAVMRDSEMAQGRAIKYQRKGGQFAETILFDANTPVLDDFARPQEFDFGT